MSAMLTDEITVFTQMQDHPNQNNPIMKHAGQKKPNMTWN
jgi:hypothetical protein